MNNKEIKIELIAYGSSFWLEAVKLREDVLRKPLGSAFTKTELDAEADHIHIAAFHDLQIVGTAVLVHEKNLYKVQRVAVLPKYRASGIGTEMMHYCEEIAESKSSTMIYCHARDSAVNFYLKNNYQKKGEEFLEDGIPHLKMFKNLS